MALALSTKPWGDYTEADYTIEQWHNACLIHQHSGPPTSKAQCKLPVKTPSGALNRDGCIAAAGALAGARSPLKASSEEKSAAAKALIRYYGQFDMKPTPMMMSLAHADMSSFLSHYGIKGMRWGIRREKGNENRPSLSLRARVGVGKTIHDPGFQTELAAVISGSLIKNLHTLNPPTKENGAKFVSNFLKDSGKGSVIMMRNRTIRKETEKIVKKALG
jgi:hypothetical protein